MKLTNRSRITLTITMLAGLLFVFTHCGAEFGGSAVSNYGDGATYPTSGAQKNNTVDPETEEGQLVQETVEVGIKGFEEVLSTMSAVTGVDTSVGRIMSTYREVESQLPSNNSIKSFSAANQVAMLKLAAEFCYEAARSNTYRNELWPSTNFGDRPDTAYNIQNRETFIEESLASFFPHLTTADEEYSEYGQELESLITDIVNDSENSTTVTRSVAFSACTTLLSSFEMMAI